MMIKGIIVALILVLLVLLLLFMFPIVQVEGDSMYPTYKDGEYILSVRFFGVFGKSLLKYGNVVVFQHPECDYHYLLIKRIYCIKDNNKSVYVLGDNSDNSLDSRYFGYIPVSSIVSVILFPREKER